MELPEGVRSRHERTKRQVIPLCAYVKVIYNTNFRDEFGGLVANAEQAATDVFNRAQEIFATFPGLDRSINLQLVGGKPRDFFCSLAKKSDSSCSKIPP